MGLNFTCCGKQNANKIIKQQADNKSSGSDPSLIKHQSRRVHKRRSTQSMQIDCTKFYANLVQTLINSSGNNQNVIASPWSILVAMTICMCGARKNTLKEMLQVLYADIIHNPDPNDSGNENESETKSMVTFENPDKITQKVIYICESLNNQYNMSNTDYGVKISTANKMYIDHSYQILPGYIDTVGLDVVESVNLKNPKKTVKIINKWCCEQTNGQIQQLVTSDNIAVCKVIVVNLVYFSGKFANPFLVRKTENNIPFYNNETRQTEICKLSMMHSVKDHYFAKNVNGVFDVVKLNYMGSKISLILAINNGSDAYYEDEGKLVFTSKDLAKINNNNNWKYGSVYLYVPKFKYQYLTEMSPTLQKMGIKDAFDDSADFSAMTGTTGLYIDKVIHQAMIEIDEKGSEASAITTDIMQGKGLRYSDSEREIPPTIRFDHPFDFIIYDNKRKINLFSGRFNGDGN